MHLIKFIQIDFIFHSEEIKNEIPIRALSDSNNVFS